MKGAIVHICVEATIFNLIFLDIKFAVRYVTCDGKNQKKKYQQNTLLGVAVIIGGICFTKLIQVENVSLKKTIFISLYSWKVSKLTKKALQRRGMNRVCLVIMICYFGQYVYLCFIIEYLLKWNFISANLNILIAHKMYWTYGVNQVVNCVKMFISFFW